MAPLTQNLSPAGTASGTVANICPSGQNFLSVKFNGMSYTPYGPGRKSGGNADFALVSKLAAAVATVVPTASVVAPWLVSSVCNRLVSQSGRAGPVLVAAVLANAPKPSNGVSIKSYRKYMPLSPR